MVGFVNTFKCVLLMLENKNNNSTNQSWIRTILKPVDSDACSTFSVGALLRQSHNPCFGLHTITENNDRDAKKMLNSKDSASSTLLFVCIKWTACDLCNGYLLLFIHFTFTWLLLSRSPAYELPVRSLVCSIKKKTTSKRSELRVLVRVFVELFKRRRVCKEKYKEKKRNRKEENIFLIKKKIM